MMVENGGQLAQWRIKPSGGNGVNVPFCLSAQAGSAGDDAFLWSLADLMTLLLVFFVLLYANAIHRSDSAAGESTPTATAVASSLVLDTVVSPAPPTRESVPSPTTGLPDQVPPVLENQTPATEDPVEPLNRQSMKSLEDSFSNDFYVRWDEKQPVFVLGERITFNVGDAVLLADSQSALKRIAALIAPLRYHRVIVSGHTDNVAIRTPVFPSNWELSAARAASVAKYLASRGVAPQRLVIQGKSEFHPLVANTSATHRRTNRRVEICLQKGAQTPDML
jgi:chemotaxis protein MotB